MVPSRLRQLATPLLLLAGGKVGSRRRPSGTCTSGALGLNVSDLREVN